MKSYSSSLVVMSALSCSSIEFSSCPDNSLVASVACFSRSLSMLPWCSSISLLYYMSFLLYMLAIFFWSILLSISCIFSWRCCGISSKPTPAYLNAKGSLDSFILLSLRSSISERLRLYWLYWLSLSMRSELILALDWENELLMAFSRWFELIGWYIKYYKSLILWEYKSNWKRYSETCSNLIINCLEYIICMYHYFRLQHAL